MNAEHGLLMTKRLESAKPAQAWWVKIGDIVVARLVRVKLSRWTPRETRWSFIGGLDQSWYSQNIRQALTSLAKKVDQANLNDGDRFEEPF